MIVWKWNWFWIEDVNKEWKVEEKLNLIIWDYGIVLDFSWIICENCCNLIILLFLNSFKFLNQKNKTF